MEHVEQSVLDTAVQRCYIISASVPVSFLRILTGIRIQLERQAEDLETGNVRERGKGSVVSIPRVAVESCGAYAASRAFVRRSPRPDTFPTFGLNRNRVQCRRRLRTPFTTCTLCTRLLSS